MVQDLQCVSYKEYITDLITDDAIEFLSDYTPKETALILSICLCTTLHPMTPMWVQMA